MYNKNPTTSQGYWDGGRIISLTDNGFSPFCLPTDANPNWRDTLYKFTPGKGWEKETK